MYLCESDHSEEELSARSSQGNDNFELYTIAFANISKPSNFIINMVVDNITLPMHRTVYSSMYL